MRFFGDVSSFRNLFLVQMVFGILVIVIGWFGFTNPPSSDQVLLYSSINEEKTVEPFQVFYESPYPLFKANFRLNNEDEEPFQSGQTFLDEGNYVFTLTTTTNITKSLFMTLDQSAPFIKNFDTSKSIHVGKTLYFDDLYSQIVLAESSYNQGPFTVISNENFKLTIAGSYQIRLVDELGNEFIYSFNVTINSIWNSNDLYWLFGGMLVLLILVSFSSFSYLEYKRKKDKKI